MRMKIIKHFVETGIARNIPYPFAPGEEVDVPQEIGKRWQKSGLAKPLVERECAMASAQVETTMKAPPQPRRKRS